MATIPTTTPETDTPEPPLWTHPGRRMTEDEFVSWCRGFERIRAEWVDGEVVVMSPASEGHVDLADFLTAVVRVFVEDRDLGRVFAQEFVCRLTAGPRRVRRLPDLMFVAADRLHLVRPTYLDGAPDLAVEVVSADSGDRDRREKFEDYRVSGVREYWVIDPATKALESWRLDPRSGAYRRAPEAEGRVASAVLPGFFLRPEWLWREPLPRVRDVLRELGL